MVSGKHIAKIAGTKTEDDRITDKNERSHMRKVKPTTKKLLTDCVFFLQKVGPLASQSTAPH